MILSTSCRYAFWLKCKYKLHYIKNILSLFRSPLYRSGSLIFGLFWIILWIIYTVSSSNLLLSSGGPLSTSILVSCLTGGGGGVVDDPAVSVVV